MLKPLGHKKIIENELEGFGIRLNSKPPNIGFKKKDKGGINLTATVSWKFSLTKKKKNCLKKEAFAVNGMLGTIPVL